MRWLVWSLWTKNWAFTTTILLIQRNNMLIGRYPALLDANVLHPAFVRGCTPLVCGRAAFSAPLVIRYPGGMEAQHSTSFSRDDRRSARSPARDHDRELSRRGNYRLPSLYWRARSARLR